MLLTEGKKSKVLQQIILNLHYLLSEHSVQWSYSLFPTGSEVFKRPQKGRNESQQLVCQTGVHQGYP